MGLNRWLLACLLALSGVGTAAAMDVTTQDPTAPHAALDGASHEGGGSTSADATVVGRDCTSPDSAADSSDAGEGGGNGGSTPHPRASHRSSLNWQSLLPGSIQ